MSRRLILLLAVVVALFTIAPAVGASHGTDHRNATFTAHLTGAEENPPVATDATGQAIVKLRNGELSYKLIVANIDEVTMAHIHCGAVGVNGGVAVTLYDGPTTSKSGILNQDVITDDDVGGCLSAELGRDARVEDLLDLIEDDRAYVNVHTTANPGGEIRGQLG